MPAAAARTHSRGKCHVLSRGMHRAADAAADEECGPRKAAALGADSMRRGHPFLECEWDGMYVCELHSWTTSDVLE
jgi:hypothetical protein